MQANLRSRRDGVLLGAKSTKNAGVPIPPHPLNGLAGAQESKNLFLITKMVLFFEIICFGVAVLKGKLISLRTKNRSSAEEVDTSDFYASQQRISQNPTVLPKH